MQVAGRGDNMQIKYHLPIVAFPTARGIARHLNAGWQVGITWPERADKES